MAFDKNDTHAPAGLRTDEFLLRPIRTSDAELDYDAVMESREFLRLWEQSSWPEDDFTVEANREDLDKLERRHADGESFAYTVMDPAETRCLGCVYILPTDAHMFSRSEISATDAAPWSAYEAAVYFWVRKARIADGLDRRLLETLDPWLERDWSIGRHLFVTSEQFEQQVSMIEGAGLRRMFEIDDPKHVGRSLAYAHTASAA